MVSCGPISETGWAQRKHKQMQKYSSFQELKNVISWIFSNNLNYSNFFQSSTSVVAFHFVLFTIKKVQLTIPMCYLIYFMADCNKIIEWFSCCAFMFFFFLYEMMCVFWFGFNYINLASDVEKYNLRKVCVCTFGFVSLQNVEENLNESQFIKIAVIIWATYWKNR